MLGRVLNAAEAVVAEDVQHGTEKDNDGDNEHGTHGARARACRRHDNWLFIGHRGRGAGNAGADFVELHAPAEKLIGAWGLTAAGTRICHNEMIPQARRKLRFPPLGK